MTDAKSKTKAEPKEEKEPEVFNDVPMDADDTWAPEGYEPGEDDPEPVGEDDVHDMPEGEDEDYLAELEALKPIEENEDGS